jgi:hypothetical protein
MKMLRDVVNRELTQKKMITGNKRGWLKNVSTADG